MEKFLKIALDVAIVLAIIVVIIGIISRLMVRPFPFGIEAQAHLQFAKFLLLFAVAVGIRQLARK